MKPRFFCAFVVGTTAFAVLMNGFAGDGVVNDSGKTWEVRYHKDHKNKHTDIALQLTVKASTAAGAGPDDLEGTLKRYDAVNPPDGSGKKTYKKKTKMGDVNLVGVITKKGGGKQRKREEFVLVGDPFVSTGKVYVLVVMGFHHGGKDRKVDDDNQVCIRLVEKEFPSLAAARAGVVAIMSGSVPCDEQPPDEDNLSEATDAPDPEYDAENP